MFLLVIILDKAKDLENIIVKFREIGVTGATVFDSIGVGRNTLYGTDLPVIASLSRIFDSESKTYNKTLMSIIRKKETLDNALKVAQDVCGDFDNPDVGIMFWLKLEGVVGFNVPDNYEKD
jgi:nitrogen regulatory protein P-II 1